MKMEISDFVKGQISMGLMCYGVNILNDYVIIGIILWGLGLAIIAYMQWTLWKTRVKP